MNFRVENLGILFGLFALAAPVLLHLIRRHRYDTSDWGAMQFLPDQVTTQRRRWLDEILLMLTRMAMIALIVLALATPISISAWLAPLGDRSTRDIVFVFDGSYSMDARIPGQPTPWDDATRQARELLDKASFGDRFAIVIARQPAFFVQADFTGNLDEIRDKLRNMPGPRGNPDMPGTLAIAWKHLQLRSEASVKQIVVFTDQQHHGWADPATLSKFDNLGDQWHADRERAQQDGGALASIRLVKVGDRAAVASLPNYALAPIVASRGIVKLGQKAAFESALRFQHFQQYERPRSVNILIDGKKKTGLALPEAGSLKQGQVPLRFEHQFDREGPHVVSLQVDADDALSADNEQHLVVEVVKDLPILLVDGERRRSAEGSSYFLEQALASPSVVAVSYSALRSELLFPESGRPAILMLADVPHLDAAQIDAIDRFLAEGGGVWVIAGPRMVPEKSLFNDQLYRQGQGWLPARLESVASAKDGVHPDSRTFQHPALEVFRAGPEGGMNAIRFAKWWRVKFAVDDRTATLAKLSNDEPFLLEKPYKKGRVMLTTAPMDRRWDSNFPGTPEFPMLTHQIAYYLAGNRAPATLLQNGAPIRVTLGTDVSRVTLRTPGIKEQISGVTNRLWTFDNTGAIGVYEVQTAQRRWAFVVQPDGQEANLAPMSDEDWQRVRDRLPVAWQTDLESNAAAPDAPRQELWWLILVAVLGLLCVEVWMTRRMTLARGR